MPYVLVLIPITKLHGFVFKACKQKIRLDPDQLSVSICCWIQRSIACLLSELIFSMLTRFLNFFFTCTCLCCKRVSFKCVYRICKTLGCCLKAHFVDPLCQARVQPGASLSPRATGSITPGRAQPAQANGLHMLWLYCLCPRSIDTQQTGCRAFSAFFLNLVFCFSSSASSSILLSRAVFLS